MNRRELLRDMLVSAASGAVSAVGITAVVWGPKLREPGAEYFPDALAGPAELIAGGPIVIQRGVNIRTEPTIPRPPFARLRGERDWSRFNVIEWESIEVVGGVPLSGADAFAIEYAEIVKGEDTYKYPKRPGDYDYWIRVRVGVKGRGEQTCFINYSGRTEDYITVVGSQYLYASVLFRYQRTPQGELLLDSKPPRSIGPETVGRITVLPSRIELARYLWTSNVANKLNRQAPYSWDESHFEETVVFPWGRSTAEHLQRKREGKPVVVFDSPPDLADQLGSPNAIDSIDLGTAINNIILARFTWNLWGLFRRADVEGDILDSEGNALDVPPEQTLVMDGDFILRKDHPYAQRYLAELQGKINNSSFFSTHPPGN